MSEQQPGTEPVQRPPAAPAPKNQGSLWGGIGLAWAVMVGGEAVLFSAGLVAWVVPRPAPGRPQPAAAGGAPVPPHHAGSCRLLAGDRWPCG